MGERVTFSLEILLDRELNPYLSLTRPLYLLQSLLSFLSLSLSRHFEPSSFTLT